MKKHNALPTLMLRPPLASPRRHQYRRFVSATGPAASLGIPEKNTFAIPSRPHRRREGQLHQADDATDWPGYQERPQAGDRRQGGCAGRFRRARRPARRWPRSPTKPPRRRSRCARSICRPPRTTGVFRRPQHNSLMAKALVGHMQQNGVKTLGHRFNDFTARTGSRDHRCRRRRRHQAGGRRALQQPVDTSVSGRCSLIAARPDAIMIAGSSTPAAVVHTTLFERGYKGQIYQTTRAAKQRVPEGRRQGCRGRHPADRPGRGGQPAARCAPVEEAGADHIKLYEAKYGAGSASSFGAYAPMPIS